MYNKLTHDLELYFTNGTIYTFIQDGDEYPRIHFEFKDFTEVAKLAIDTKAGDWYFISANFLLSKKYVMYVVYIIYIAILS